MKIGLVLPSVPAYSETFFTSKIKGLQANGLEVVLFVNHFSSKTSLHCNVVSSPKFSKNKLKNSFISLHCFLKALFLGYASTRKLYLLDKKDNLSFAKRIKSIVINSHILTQKLDWLHFGFGTMAINRENVAEAIGAKMGVSFRGFDHYVYPLKNVGCYKILFSKKVKYHVLSEGMKSDLMNQLIPEENIIKITPAIDTNLFFNENSFENMPTFLTVARLHWIKGLDYILEAFSILNKRGFDFQYKIIGDGAEKERLQFLVHQLELNNKVHFLGKLEQDEVKQELLKTSYYIQYSHQEGFCNAVLEAQAMGKVCIVSDADGLIENVLDKKTGFVVPKRNPEALANKIEAVFNLNRDVKEFLIEKAVERIKSNFTFEKQINQFMDFYTK
ncbi:glycosyltransferase family 4 protein [Flavobacterium jejuense]|uniref:Glycosyltransferase family 4 protein n=1 Tax=Flavobacterium jejuense TaxID=1544455 RepID=A0ABX0IQQ8_9FLAO|nr:glycosyltransferase [Flavobacterium jejuense]NHN26174.1 glycosyltransferase family 4 protein [Flavobacterium jejuense]